jgi:hypothetical protein
VEVFPQVFFLNLSSLMYSSGGCGKSEVGNNQSLHNLSSIQGKDHIASNKTLCLAKFGQILVNSVFPE